MRFQDFLRANNPRVKLFVFTRKFAALWVLVLMSSLKLTTFVVSFGPESPNVLHYLRDPPGGSRAQADRAAWNPPHPP